ncbi:MAG: sirohydrochlorin nickelochelatase, partial [Methanobrevibacter sp.]|nr:sirohydrochlorin nickelochelatase [Methanobrevibacter sp.]
MDTNSKLSSNTGVILVSHGSTLPYAEEVFTEIKEKFIKKTGYPSEIGYMKVSEPTIAGAVDILKEEVDDLDNIIALPVFLAPGIHTNIDIPQLLGLEPLEVDPRCP